METWTVNMDVTFKADGIDNATDLAHAIASMLEYPVAGYAKGTLSPVTEVTLGEYRKEAE